MSVCRSRDIWDRLTSIGQVDRLLSVWVTLSSYSMGIGCIVQCVGIILNHGWALAFFFFLMVFHLFWENIVGGCSGVALLHILNLVKKYRF